jgi:hypothetical protein
VVACQRPSWLDSWSGVDDISGKLGGKTLEHGMIILPGDLRWMDVKTSLNAGRTDQLRAIILAERRGSSPSHLEAVKLIEHGIQNYC